MPPPAHATLAIEMGGTSSRAVRDGAGLAAMVTCSSAGVAAAPDPIEALADLWSDLATRVDLPSPRAVALALPGPVRRGRVERLPTLFGDRVVDLDAAGLAGALFPDAAIWVMNDLTAAGQALLASGERDFCVVTLGSGIGSKLCVDGNFLIGPRGFGGEIGHWAVRPGSDLHCDCGGMGHLGALASGRGALRWAQRRALEDAAGFRASAAGESAAGDPARLTSEAIARHFQAGDRWTRAAMGEPARALGETFALIHLATGIERFFITGGFGVAMGDVLTHMIAQAAADAAWASGIDWDAAIRIPADAGSLGVRGALSYAALHHPDWLPAAASRPAASS